MFQALLLLSTVSSDSIASLATSTTAVLLEAFQDPFGSVHILQSSTSQRSAQLQADLLDAVLPQLDGTIVLRIGVTLGEVSRRPWVWNVFLVDSYEGFTERYGTLNVDKYDFSGRYLVVYSSPMNEADVRRVLNDLWKLQIINVVIIGLVKQDVELWTYYAFSSRACRMVHLAKISKVLVEEMYTDKTTSFYGCLLKVASFETRPATIKHRYAKGKFKMSGFEGDILNVLEKKLNFRTLIYEPPNGEQWGYPSEHNSTGIMRMIYKEEVDFGMSCLGISVARLQIMKAGIAHHTTSIVLAVPKGRPYTPLEKLIRPFNACVWLLTGTVLLVAFISIGVIELRSQTLREFVYGRAVRTPRLNLIQIFFGLGIPLCPKRNFARTLLFLWIFFCFVLRTLYQSAMFKHLQQSENHLPPKTLNEIDQTEAFYYVAESGERFFESFPDRLRRVRHLPQQHNNIIQKLDWMEDHPESPDVVMGTLDAMAYHNLQYRRKGREPVPICREFITTFSMAFYYPKKSMLTAQFDGQLSWIQAAGLINYWVKQYGNYEFFERSVGGAEPRKLSNQHLMVAYELYGVLVLSSWVIFGFELIYSWVKRESQSKGGIFNVGN